MTNERIQKELAFYNKVRERFQLPEIVGELDESNCATIHLRDSRCYAVATDNGFEVSCAVVSCRGYMDPPEEDEVLLSSDPSLLLAVVKAEGAMKLDEIQNYLHDEGLAEMERSIDK